MNFLDMIISLMESGSVIKDLLTGDHKITFERTSYTEDISNHGFIEPELSIDDLLTIDHLYLKLCSAFGLQKVVTFKTIAWRDPDGKLHLVFTNRKNNIKFLYSDLTAVYTAMHTHDDDDTSDDDSQPKKKKRKYEDIKIDYLTLTSFVRVFTGLRSPVLIIIALMTALKGKLKLEPTLQHKKHKAAHTD